MFGSDSGRGSAQGWAPSLMAPRAMDSTSRVHDDRRLADHLVRLEQDHGRQREPKGLRGLEVDDELELHRLLHGQVRRLGTLQDFVHVGSDLSAHASCTLAL